MPTALLFPVILRLAGPVAFVLAAAIAGGMNRSFVLIPLLVVVATATTVIIRIFSPAPALDLRSVLSPDAPSPKANPFRGVGRRLAIGLIGYALVFGFAALVSALFKTTEFEPQIRPSDIWFLAVPALLAVVGAWVSARIGLNQMAGMMGQMQDMFAEMQSKQDDTAPEDDTFTFEGEIIDPDDRDA